MFGDRQLIGEVLLNLTTNAIKFTPRGGSITTTLLSKRELAVTDTGGGISEKILPNLFKHEVRTTGVGTSGEIGTGLGLPLCHDIMKAHGGTLRVATGPYGSTFVAELPEEKPLVLLVDDQEVHRAMMRQHIEKISNVEFAEASNGLEALESIKKNIPVLVITDINMPEMNGLDLLKEIRAYHSINVLPVIINTAITSSSDTSEGKTIDNKTLAFELGANDFIMKPVIKDDFIPRVKRYLP